MGGQVVHDHADFLGLREVEIDQVLHALGEVLCGASVRHFHPSPGMVGVEEDEQVGGSVALVLTVEALELAGLGRNGFSHLADELGGAFVEADDGTAWVRRLGVEIEHVLHARDIFGVHRGYAPHVLAPGLEMVLGQTPAHRGGRQGLVLGEFDECIGQQFQRPARASLGRLGAGGGHQQGLLLSRQLTLRPGPGLLAQRRLQVALHEAALGAVHRRAADLHRLDDRLVVHAGVGGQ
jgi:hypothetical protein